LKKGCHVLGKEITDVTMIFFKKFCTKEIVQENNVLEGN